MPFNFSPEKKNGWSMEGEKKLRFYLLQQEARLDSWFYQDPLDKVACIRLISWSRDGGGLSIATMFLRWKTERSFSRPAMRMTILTSKWKLGSLLPIRLRNQKSIFLGIQRVLLHYFLRLFLFIKKTHIFKFCRFFKRTKQGQFLTSSKIATRKIMVFWQCGLRDVHTNNYKLKFLFHAFEILTENSQGYDRYLLLYSSISSKKYYQ